MKINKHIEIVRSEVSGLSSMSVESCSAAQKTLAKHYAAVSITNVNNVSDLENVVARNPDLVFLGMEYIPVHPELGRLDEEKIWLTTYFDTHEIAYTGSSQKALALGRDKTLAKQCIADAGLDTAPFCVIPQNQSLICEEVTLAYPLFVKPKDRGGGLGIDSDSVVNNFEQLYEKTSSIADVYMSDSLVEEYLPGREFSVAILRLETLNHYVAMPLELIAPADEYGARILGSKTKAADIEQVVAVTDHGIRKRVSQLAIDVFHALGARDFGRIDIRLDSAGTPQFLEANLIPSLISGYGNFPKACVLNEGLGYESMILRIIRLAFEDKSLTAHNPSNLNFSNFQHLDLHSGASVSL